MVTYLMFLPACHTHSVHEAFTCVAKFAQVRCQWISCYVIDRFATYELTQLNGAVVKIHVVKNISGPLVCFDTYCVNLSGYYHSFVVAGWRNGKDRLNRKLGVENTWRAHEMINEDL